MQIEFTNAIQNAGQFPASIIKTQPRISLRSCHFFGANFPAENVTTYSRARYALSAAASFLKTAGKKNTILLPAYHCPALVEPFMHAGYDIVFYPQLQDLSSDLNVFNQLLNNSITHVLVVRFFGFSQNAEQLITLAHSAGKKVIEDNAHSMIHFLQTCNSKRTDVAASVSSISKTLGTADGGVLYLPGFSGSCQQPDLKSELKAWLSGQRYIKSSRGATEFRYFKPEIQHQDCLRSSRWLMIKANYLAIRHKRRENFGFLASKLKDSSTGRLLYPKLQDDDVPYVVPFLLNDSKTFEKLRQHQVQVLRWEEIAQPLSAENCSFRENLVQIPVHQQLSNVNLKKLVDLLV